MALKPCHQLWWLRNESKLLLGIKPRNLEFPIVAIEQQLKMLVYSEDQQAKKMLQDMRWDKELPWYWNNSQNRILGQPAQKPQLGPRKSGLSFHQGQVQWVPEQEVMTGRLLLFHRSLRAQTDKWKVQAQINYFGSIIIQTNPVYLFNFEY